MPWGCPKPGQDKSLGTSGQCKEKLAPWRQCQSGGINTMKHKDCTEEEAFEKVHQEEGSVFRLTEREGHHSKGTACVEAVSLREQGRFRKR